MDGGGRIVPGATIESDAGSQSRGFTKKINLSPFIGNGKLIRYIWSFIIRTLHSP